MTAPRLHCPMPLDFGEEIALPANAARHVQVLRLQPGDRVELFHGGLPDAAAAPSLLGHWQAKDAGWVDATITQMGRSSVHVRIGQHHAPVTLPMPRIHIACGMPANERMDWLVEKATELGAASIQPLQTERSVLRLGGERAAKKQAHWQAIAVAACEQSGRTAVPWVRPVCSLAEFLRQPASGVSGSHLVLSLQADSQPLRSCVAQAQTAFSADSVQWLLSGPEGGLSAAEEEAALAQGWQPVSLGRYTLRAETAPLAALVLLMQAG